MAEMTTQNIIKNCDELKGSKQNWKEVYAKLHVSVKANKFRIFRAGNTLFWVKLLEPGTGQVFAFNADPKEKFFENVLQFLKALKAVKYTEITAVMPVPGLFRQLQRAGYAVDVEKIPSVEGPASFKGTIHV
jgi:phosphoribosylpyrophosphate synthetase